MAGEEVVGGIKGFLRLDADQFHREILRALAEVELLDGKDIDVRIDVHGDKVSGDLSAITRHAGEAGTSVQKLGTSFASGGMRSGPLLIGGIAAGMALIGPTTGAAVGALVGFTGVVGGSILAWQGFKDELESGSELGEALQTELDGLSDALNHLQGVAAGAAAGGVLEGLEHVRKWLPSLTDEVGILGSRLGSAFNISTQALTSGLDAMMPLLLDGGVYAERFAMWLRDVAESQDFKDFVAYAQQQLPAFIEMVSSLTSGFVALAAAIAPVGEFIVASMTLTGKSLEATGKGLDFVAKNFNPVVAGLNLLSGGSKTAAADTQGLESATKAAASTAAAFSPAVTEQADALGVSAAALAEAKTQQEAHATAAANATLQMQLENDAAGLLKQGLDALNGINLNVASAQTSSAAATLKMVEALTKSKGQLDLNSAAGVKARQAIEGKARADQALATATATATGSTKAGTASLAASKAAAIKAAQASGTLTGEVRKYIEKLYAIPEVEKTKIEIDKANAMAEIAAFKAALAGIKNKSVVITATQRFVNNSAGPGNAMGGGSTFDADGSIKFYANGGVSGSESHVAMIAPAGTTRVWNEPETGGEAYIPLAKTKRARSERILAETNRLMGNPLGAGTVALDAASIAALARAVAGVQLTAAISSSQFDMAMGGAR